MKKLVELNSIRAGYGETVVIDNINLDIYENDFLGIIGPNGGGKTTLLKVILGLIRPYSGTIRFSNGSSDPGGMMIGYLPQFKILDHQFPIKVMDVVLSGLMSTKHVLKNFAREDRDRVDKILREFGVYHLRKKSIGELSGGQTQRVFLCRALISSPELLILDEPGTFIDRDFSRSLNDILKNLNSRIAIVLVSHDIGSILSSVKNIACIDRTLNYHNSDEITPELLEEYTCGCRIIDHGDIPHTVLKRHGK